jgi:hypothetical protein
MMMMELLDFVEHLLRMMLVELAQGMLWAADMMTVVKAGMNTINSGSESIVE